MRFLLKENIFIETTHNLNLILNLSFLQHASESKERTKYSISFLRQVQQIELKTIKLGKLKGLTKKIIKVFGA